MITKFVVVPGAMSIPVDEEFNHEYVVYDESGKRVKILCRKCDDVIADQIEYEGAIDYETGVAPRTSGFQLSSNYALVKLVLSNNMTLDCAMCKRCAKRAPFYEVQKIYDSEILAIERDAVIHHNEAATAPLLAELRANSVVRRIGLAQLSEAQATLLLQYI